MAGRHEPGSQSSFYLSLATAGLRFVLVIAAVVLGIFVLTRAFPTSSEAPPPAPSPSPIPAPSPEPTESPAGEPEPPAEEQVTLDGVRVGVQNGTSTDGLAADTAQRMVQQLGVRIRDEDIGNAPRSYDITTIFFQRGFRAEAKELIRAFFNGSGEATRASADAPSDVQLIVVVGEDYAQRQG